MKKLLAPILCVILVLSMVAPCYATSQSEVVFYEQTILEDGTVIIDEIIATTNARSTDLTAERRQTIHKGDTLIGSIAFRATYRYNGSTVSVVSKEVTRTDTYDGYKYKQTSFTSSGGTVTLEGKLTKLLIFNTSFTMTMTCDKNGNLSGT